MSEDIPREDERMTSGFSAEVAMAVTHPPWPSRVPLRTRDSDMLEEEERRGEG